MVLLLIREVQATFFHGGQEKEIKEREGNAMKFAK